MGMSFGLQRNEAIIFVGAVNVLKEGLIVRTYKSDSYGSQWHF